jgi:uncharacterized protein (TIGR00255 family)
MTGVGRAEAILPPWNSKIVVDIRTVNHKYLELTAKLPPQIAAYEGEVRDMVRRRVRRGYIQLQISLDESAEAPTLALDHRMVRDYLSLSRELKLKYRIPGEINLDTVLAYPGIIAPQKADADHDRLWRQCRKVIALAVSRLVKMQQVEGTALIHDLRKRVTRIRHAVHTIEQRVPERLKERRANLLAQLKDLNVESDSKRILEEVAFISEKVDIHEECVRLKSHCSLFLGALTSSTASGKKLDFIAQEMQRETDTLAAKARDMAISHRAIEIKGEIEKLKEQVRNVE